MSKYQTEYSKMAREAIQDDFDQILDQLDQVTNDLVSSEA